MWSLNASETGESTKCPWVGVGEGTAAEKHIFSALSPHAINPTTPTLEHFVLSPVSLASRDQDDGPIELNDRHLQSHGKIGNCEQSTLLKTESLHDVSSTLIQSQHTRKRYVSTKLELATWGWLVESTSIFMMIVSTDCATKRVTYVVRQYFAEIIKTCAKVVHVLERSGIFFAALSFPRGSTPLDKRLWEIARFR